MILLRTGNHGDVSIAEAVNSDFITIAADDGQKPTLSSLKLQGSSKWKFNGLIVQRTNSAPTWSALVELLNHDFYGPTDNIIFERNQLGPAEDISKWNQQDWHQHAPWGLRDQGNVRHDRGERSPGV